MKGKGREKQCSLGDGDPKFIEEQRHRRTEAIKKKKKKIRIKVGIEIQGEKGKAMQTKCF